MLKRLLNECVLSFDLIVRDRLLIQEPKEMTAERPRIGESQVTEPDRTHMPGGSASTIYIPGSSLKGAMRSQAERIARTLNRNGAGACNPFMRRESDPFLSCGDRLAAYQRQADGPTPSTLIYREACPICRLFGYLGQGKRLRVTDFYPVDEPIVEQVTHIGVDRLTGGVAKGLTFTLAYVYRARLRGQIVIENYELWQLGLLGLLWRDLSEGLIAIGHNQTTGGGVLGTELRGLELSTYGLHPTVNRLAGIGSLLAESATKEAARAYGYSPQERLEWTPLNWMPLEERVGWGLTLDAEQASECWRALAPVTARTLRTHAWSQHFSPTPTVQGAVDEGGRA